jgi:hypothetical protein
MAEIYQPKKSVFAEIVFSDVAAGLAAGTARGLDAGVLSAMREVDALCQVARAFDDPAATEPAAPLREIRDLEAEMLVADLDLIEKRIERLKKEKGKPREEALLKVLREHLEAEKPLRALEMSDEDWGLFSGFRFLSQKPLLIVLNVDEADVAKAADAAIAAHAKVAGLGLVVLSAKVEQDIAQMEPAEQKEFLGALGLGASAKDRFIREAFALLDLISFLTVGPDECRAWPIHRGLSAQRAAGKVHSDIERGFIRAEVIRYEDLLQLRSEAKCREAGKLRLEGKEYVVQDGDIVHYRFNV